MAAQRQDWLEEKLAASAAAAVLRFLSDQAAHGGETPERRETHISHVFLTADRAYKLKKPVCLDFLDFSTLALREAACRREVEVNRRFAPELYLGLRPIVTTPQGEIAFGPLLTDPEAAAPAPAGAATLDWVIEMRRFDRDAEFDALAEARALKPSHLTDLADRVSDAHRAAPKRTPEDRGANARELVLEARGAIRDPALAATASAWSRRALREVDRIDPLLRARRRHGFPRRLHGDLHLGNICLLNGAPTPFDAIEFDDRIATVDPLYDVAFTAMDLLWRGERGLANAFMSRYLGATRDYGGLAAWPLFLSLRAAIRAMTASLSGEGALAEAKLAFARRLLAAPRQPIMIAVGGLSGSGKSTLAEALAPRLGAHGGAPILSSDATRKRLHGEPPEATLPVEAYASVENARVYQRLRRDARRALRAGAAVVLDATFSDRMEREAARAVAERVGAPFIGLWLDAARDTRLQRVEARAASSERRASDADVAVAAAQSGGLAEQESHWRRLDAARGTDAALAAALRLPPIAAALDQEFTPSAART